MNSSTAIISTSCLAIPPGHESSWLFRADGLDEATAKVRRAYLFLREQEPLAPSLQALLEEIDSAFDLPFQLFTIDIHPASAGSTEEESVGHPGIRVCKPTDRLRSLMVALRAAEVDFGVEF